MEQVINYKVFGVFNGRRTIYGITETEEGANLLKEEAIRVGWKHVSVSPFRPLFY